MTIEELALLTKIGVAAGAAAWGGTCAVVGVLWKKTQQLQRKLAGIQEESARGMAICELASNCAIPSCPIRPVVVAMGCALILCLVSCEPARAPMVFDKKVLIVFRNESPTSGGALGAFIEPFKPLIKLVLP